MSGDAPGFFSRWSQRKTGKQPGVAGVASAPAVPAEPAPSAPLQAPVAAVVPGDTMPAVVVPGATVARPVNEHAVLPAADVPTAPLPTLEDVARLRADSDFSPFVGRGIAPAVKNAAMKKLFADPHFNVMDGLDIYIDDYSIPSPLSEQDLKKMVAAQFIKLVEEEQPPVPPRDTQADEPLAGDVPTEPTQHQLATPPDTLVAPLSGASAQSADSATVPTVTSLPLPAERPRP